MNNLTILEVYEHHFEAYRDKQFLEEEDISCYIANNYALQTIWLWTLLVGGIQLQVFEKDLEKARSILLKKREEQKTENLEVDYTIEKSEYNNKTCPKCNSNHIYRDENINWIFRLSIFFLGFPVKIRNHIFHCYYCGNEWKEKI